MQYLHYVSSDHLRGDVIIIALFTVIFTTIIIVGKDVGSVQLQFEYICETVRVDSLAQSSPPLTQWLGVVTIFFENVRYLNMPSNQT